MRTDLEEETRKKAIELEYYTLVGMICDSAAKADLVLFNTFRILLQTEHLAASAIYFSIDSTTAKIKIVNALAHYYCQDDNERQLVSKITNNMAEVASVRNDVAHSARGTKSTTPNAKPRRVNPRNRAQTLREASNAPLMQMAKNCDKLAGQAKAAYFEICEIHGEPQEVWVAEG